MTATFRQNRSLPQLAWLATVERHDLALTAMFGSRVEQGPDFLVAGVWNGHFGEGAFEATDCFFGTGLVIRDGAVTFVSSAAMTDAIYYTESEDRLTAANSLPLLLAATRDRLDPGFAFYDRISQSLQSGIDDYERAIPTERGRVLRLFCRNLRVTAWGVEECDKRRPPAFPDFRSYLCFITESYAGIYRNIRDPGRRHRLDVVSTQSRGYDSTAVNAIAAPHGIDTVFTIAEAKEAGGFVGTVPPSDAGDDGSEICAVLGLRPTHLDRRLFARSFEEEYLFYATTTRAEATKLLGIKPHLRRTSVMLTGVRGDVVWATDQYYLARPEVLAPRPDGKDGPPKSVAAVSPEMLGDDLRGPDTWLHGLSEIGLQWGLIQVAPSYIGDRNRRDIFRVTMSDEMAPWRLGGEYDRPIARRIAEEIGGIARDSFGRQKQAAAVEFPLPPVPIGTSLRREYFAFLREHRIVSRFWRLGYRWVHQINSRIVFRTPHHYRYFYIAGRLLSKLAGREVELPTLYRRLDGRLYCFCVNKRAEDYKAAIHAEPFGAGMATAMPDAASSNNREYRAAAAV